MFRLVISKFILVTSLALALPSLVACSKEPSDSDEAAASGSLSLPLLASSNGHAYRLSNALVYISGPQTVQLFSSNDPSETVLSSTLATGDYTAYLFNWSLEREAENGTFVPVQASLVSSYAVGFSIYNGTTSTVSYQFSTDGVIVTVGSGGLNVAVAVDENAAICAPFGDDCGPGSWCPPTGLTGAARACVTAGSIAIGELCASPHDCVANSSCFDLGAGPRCVELCPLDAIGTECVAGGICEASGHDYGVCRAAPSQQP